MDCCGIGMFQPATFQIIFPVLVESHHVHRCRTKLLCSRFGSDSQRLNLANRREPWVIPPDLSCLKAGISEKPIS